MRKFFTLDDYCVRGREVYRCLFFDWCTCQQVVYSISNVVRHSQQHPPISSSYFFVAFCSSFSVLHFSFNLRSPIFFVAVFIISMTRKWYFSEKYFKISFHLHRYVIDHTVYFLIYLVLFSLVINHYCIYYKYYKI